MTKKVLLLDTGFSALPIYSGLIAAGHDVFVMGNRPQDAIAIRAGDRWIEQDYSRVAEVSRHADRLGIDCLVPGCTDVSIATCTSIAGGGHLDSAAANLSLSDKQLFRDLCSDLELPAPRSLPLDRFPRSGRFICKPVDAFSGRGITEFEGTDEAALQAALSAARSASPSGKTLVEPFVDGQLHSWSGFLEGGAMTDGFFVCEGSSINPFAVDTSYVVHAMPEGARAQLSSAISRIANALGLVDGLMHTQFIWDGQDVFIIEIARRCPGDLYALLIEYATGYAYARKYGSYFTGDSFVASASEQRAVLRHTVTSPAAMTYAGLTLDVSLPLRAWFALEGMGKRLPAGHAGRIGILFSEVANEAERETAYQLFLNRQVYRLT